MSLHSLTPFWRDRHRHAIVLCFVAGCVDPPSPAQTQGDNAAAREAATGVLLSGSFTAVAKPAEGTVAIVKTTTGYELLLRGVKVADGGPVHVYLVGLDTVRSTSDLDQVEEKYDFGELDTERQAQGQHIPLPSRPATSLRSVALVNPKFGVVLASSELKSSGD